MRRAAFQKYLLMSNIASSIDNGPVQSKRPAWKVRVITGLLMGMVALLFSACSSTVRVKDTSRTFNTVVIDPGHGGSARGTWSRWAGAEKTAALNVGLRLEPKLRAAGFNTVMTRTKDVDVELNQRAKISNRQTNAVFVSIHFNEAGSRKVRGTETFYKSAPSRALAGRIQAALVALPGHTSRGVKTANFRVLRLNEYPAVLVECGFFSNPTEGARCATPAHQEKIAQALADAIIAQRGGPLTGKVADGVAAQ